MAAPTFVGQSESVFNSNATPKSASVTTQIGDVLVVKGAVEDATSTLTISNTGTLESWTLKQSVTTANRCRVFLWTAVAAAAQTTTINVARTGGAGPEFGMTVSQWRNSDGVGNTNKSDAADAAPSVDLTTTQDNSAIDVLWADFEAGVAEGAGVVTWRNGAGTLTETLGTSDLGFDDANYSVRGGHHADAGAVGTYTLGASAPTGPDYSIVVTEIKGTAAAAADGFMLVVN